MLPNRLPYEACIDEDTGEHHVKDKISETYVAGPFSTRHEALDDAEQRNIKAFYESMGS